MAEAGIGGLAARLRHAREAARLLAEETDILNRALSEVQRELIELRLGVWGFTDLGKDVDLDDDPEVEHWLWFAKFEEGWGLYIEKRHPTDPTLSRHVPLLKTSRELRLKAADKLEDVVADLLQTLEMQVSEVKAKVVKVDSITQQIREAKS